MYFEIHRDRGRLVQKKAQKAFPSESLPFIFEISIVCERFACKILDKLPYCTSWTVMYIVYM